MSQEDVMAGRYPPIPGASPQLTDLLSKMLPGMGFGPGHFINQQAYCVQHMQYMSCIVVYSIGVAVIMEQVFGERLYGSQACKRMGGSFFGI